MGDKEEKTVEGHVVHKPGEAPGSQHGPHSIDQPIMQPEVNQPGDMKKDKEDK